MSSILILKSYSTCGVGYGLLRVALTQRLASPMYLVSSPSAILLHKTILS
ncbi:hypothetical protein [Leptospira noguchii]|nr:hypothetical protein [Leptospira noguchii]UOG51077.1 hypothetical protein MAL09_10005 [Leptospira noguchii]